MDQGFLFSARLEFLAPFPANFRAVWKAHPFLQDGWSALVLAINAIERAEFLIQGEEVDAQVPSESSAFSWTVNDARFEIHIVYPCHLDVCCFRLRHQGLAGAWTEQMQSSV